MIKKILMALAAVILLSWGIMEAVRFSNADMPIGVSFSAEYSRYLGLDPRENLTKIFDEWNFKYVRLTAQWNSIEKISGKYDFSDLDWQMDLAAANGAKVMLAIGQKTPRWPECHIPEWASGLPKEEYRANLLNYISVAVKRYEKHPALEIWQVENEPYFPFGVCPPDGAGMLAEEIALTRKLDAKHPTITTDSGELSFWARASRRADLFGATMYRVVWNRAIGYWKYWWMPPSYYSLRAWMNGLPLQKVFITELQAEPWIPRGDTFSVSLNEQFKSMNVKQLEENLLAARQTGFARAYLWGAEWWAWLEQKGDSEISDYVRDLKK